MNCKIVLSQLDDYLDRELQPVQYAQVEAHLGECESCHQAWQQALQFQQMMKEHPMPAPDAGFEDRAFAKLPRRQVRATKSVLHAGFGGAVAASLMLFVIATIFMRPEINEQAVANIQLTLHQSKKVNMVFNVPEAVAEATFSMQVPEHIEIAGRKGLHQVEWKTALKKGKNLLSLPIVANMAESGEMVAKIKYGNKEKIFRMKLDIHKLEQGLSDVIYIEAV